MKELINKIMLVDRYKEKITKTRITKNGLFIYGGYYKTSFGEKQPIYTYISKLESNNINYIIELLETFVDEVERLKEAI